jgi:DNA-binding HxlR family transcriptional regulator
MRKESSTNALNEKNIHANCGMAYTLSLIGGRWKPNILWRLLRGAVRYSELKRSIEGVTERILIAQLRELEADGLVQRTVYPEVPPRVEYQLTPLGWSMQSILENLSDWGVGHREQ